MRLIKLLLISVMIMPTLFIIGTIAETADALEPFSVGNCKIRFDYVAQVGEFIKNAAEGPTIKEMDILRGLFQEIMPSCYSVSHSDIGFIKRLTEGSV